MSRNGGNGNFTRRRFGRGLLTAAAIATQAPAQEQRSGTTQESAPFSGPIEFHRHDIDFRLKPFPMTAVRLTGGPWKQAQEANRRYLNRLSTDRLLHTFRLNAGLPSTAQPLGGWEEPKGELRGHFTGHYLSACALMYASTGDTAIKAKGDVMVAGLAKCQARLGGGYLSAFPTEFFDRLTARQKVWAPFYTIHKIMAGMLDMHLLTGNRQALEVLEGMSEWADHYSAPHSEEHMQDILNTEYGGIAETLYSLTAVTGDARWAVVGDRFTKKRFLNPLALRRDVLRGLHVNTHIPQVIAAARRYEISGDMRFHDAADYFWYEVTGARTYVTGGTSNNEGWLTPPRRLAEEMKQAVDHAECCCCYNMLKLTRQLYSWTADPRYFDYYERALVNHRLGTIRPDTGATMYYLSLTPGTYKTFGTEDQTFWCCTGSGVEEYSKLNDSIYWHDGDGLYVNLFIPSELDWAERGLKIRQETNFPEQSGTALTITAVHPVETSLRLRIPEWADGAKVRINGRALESSASPGSYLAIRRTWKSGDRIELELPMKLRVERMPDDPSIAAVLHGPIVLAGDLGVEGLTPQAIIGPMAPKVDKSAALPALNLADLKPAGKPLTYRAGAQSLMPLNQLLDRRYTVYWKT